MLKNLKRFPFFWLLLLTLPACGPEADGGAASEAKTSSVVQDFASTLASNPTLLTGTAAGSLGSGPWTIASPLANERFVSGESVELTMAPPVVQPSGLLQATPPNFVWTSSIDGPLGKGTSVLVPRLSVGTHVITVSVAGSRETEQVNVRVFADLGQLYGADPSNEELQRVLHEFRFVLNNGPDSIHNFTALWPLDPATEEWSTYPFVLPPRSTGYMTPSEAVALAKIDLFRHQQFSKPIPLLSSGERTLYEHLINNTREIHLDLDCSDNHAGGGTATFTRGFSSWLAGGAASNESPWACMNPLFSQTQSDSLEQNYTNIFIAIHENRHNEALDTGHNCPGGGQDPSLDLNAAVPLKRGSGFAASAIYLMWVYKYGLFDNPAAKAWARDGAIQQLQNSFCFSPLLHPDSDVQAIVDELIGPQ
jgi:hypothetical protein